MKNGIVILLCIFESIIAMRRDCIHNIRIVLEKGVAGVHLSFSLTFLSHIDVPGRLAHVTIIRPYNI